MHKIYIYIFQYSMDHHEGTTNYPVTIFNLPYCQENSFILYFNDCVRNHIESIKFNLEIRIKGYHQQIQQIKNIFRVYIPNFYFILYDFSGCIYVDYSNYAVKIYNASYQYDNILSIGSMTYDTPTFDFSKFDPHNSDPPTFDPPTLNTSNL